MGSSFAGPDPFKQFSFRDILKEQVYTNNPATIHELKKTPIGIEIEAITQEEECVRGQQSII